MKKLFLFAVAAVGLCMVSCNQKKDVETTQVESVDSVAATVADPAAEMQAAIEANDTSKFQKIVATVTEKFEGLKDLADSEAVKTAKEYVAKAQAFLKENADKIKGFVGGNATISGLLDKVTAIPADALSLGEDAKEAVEDAAAEKVEEAKDAAAEKVDAVKDAAAGKVEAAKEAVDNTKKAVKETVDNAKETGKKAVEDVKGAVNDVKKGLGL